jgi:pimeloyl-ACP methyl ester carboxylesterase
MAFFTFTRDSVKLCFRDVGDGPCVIFQHGLGGDESQVEAIFPSEAPVRRLTLECRGHGRSDLGPKEHLSISIFADDVAALAASRGIESAIVGGVSMGAAIALRLAVRRPELVVGLVLARPAWITTAMPVNLESYASVADLLSRYSRGEALRRFEASAAAVRIAREAPANYVTLRGFFNHGEPQVLATLLRAITSCEPGIKEADLRRLNQPALIIGHGADLAHPLQTAVALAELIPRAKLVEITPKAVDPEAHIVDMRQAVAGFLRGLRADNDRR